MAKEYICFDVTDCGIEDLVTESNISEAKNYQYYLEVIYPNNNPAGKQIGTLDLTKKRD